MMKSFQLFSTDSADFFNLLDIRSNFASSHSRRRHCSSSYYFISVHVLFNLLSDFCSTCYTFSCCIINERYNFIYVNFVLRDKKLRSPLQNFFFGHVCLIMRIFSFFVLYFICNAHKICKRKRDFCCCCFFLSLAKSILSLRLVYGICENGGMLTVHWAMSNFKILLFAFFFLFNKHFV